MTKIIDFIDFKNNKSEKQKFERIGDRWAELFGIASAGNLTPEQQKELAQVTQKKENMVMDHFKDFSEHVQNQQKETSEGVDELREKIEYLLSENDKWRDMYGESSEKLELLELFVEYDDKLKKEFDEFKKDIENDTKSYAESLEITHDNSCLIERVKLLDKDQAVLDWIKDNFEMDAVTVEKVDLFPHGHEVRDPEGGRMIVFYDLLYDRVDYRYPDE